MHVCAIDVYLAGPLFHKTPLATDVVAVVLFDCLLADGCAVIARDIQHGLDDFGDHIFWIHRQQLDSLPIVDRHARIGRSEINTNFDGHEFESLFAPAGITPMDRITPSASIEPEPVMDFAP